MAAKPLDDRLNSILPQPLPVEQPAPELPEPLTYPEDSGMTTTDQPGQPAMEDPTQVAGVGSFLRGVVKQGADQALEGLKKNPQASQRPIVPGPGTPPGELPKATKIPGRAPTEPGQEPAGKGLIMPEAPQQTVDNVQAAIEKRAADVNIDGKPPEEAFNLANMQTDNISAIIGGVGDALGIKTQKVTFDQIKEKAAGLGVDERFLTRLLDNNNQMAGNAVDVYRAMQVLEASADELGRLFGLVANGQATDIQKLQLRQQVTMHGLIQKAVKGVQSETARALAVMRVPRDTSNIDLIRRTLEEGGGENSLQDLARAYLSAPNQAAKNQIIEKSMFSTAKDVWFTTWINGLLSSPVTHAKNIAGNTLFGAYQVPERLMAAFYSNVLPKWARSWRATVPGSAKEKVEFDELLTEMQALTTGVREGLELGRRTWDTGMPSDPISKLELTRRGDQPEISAAAFGMQADGLLAKGVDLYGKAITIPGKALLTQDEFYKGWFYRTAFNRLAIRRGKSVYREAIEGGADEALAGARAQQEVENIFKNPPADIDAEAMEYARKSTFTMDLPPALRSIEGAFQHPIAKMVVPFFRTPANIALEVIERTPFAPISSRFRTDMAKGGPYRDLAMAKVTMGSALLVTFASLSSEGYLTGRGPGRRADREALLRGKWQPYSVVLPRADFEGQVERLSQIGRVSIGDDKIYLSFNGMEPISAFLAMSADYAEYARYEEDAGAIEEVFMGALYGMYNYMGEQPWLTGVADIAGAFGGGIANTNKTVEDTVDALVKQFTGFGIGGSPAGAYNSAVATIERFMDPMASDTSVKGEDLPMGVKGFYEAFKKYQARVPGLSATLPPRLNLWGDPIMQGKGKAYEMILPTRVTPGQFSPTDDILVQMGSPITMPQRKIDGIDLGSEQYNRLLTIYGKELEVNGMNAKAAIFDLATSPGFDMQSLDQQQRLIRLLHDKYMTAARQQLLAEDPELSVKIDQLKANREAFGLFYKGD